MTDHDQDVKSFRRRQSATEWMDCHPRTGWWLAGIGIINMVLNLLDLVVR